MARWTRRLPFKVDVAGIIQIMGKSLYSRSDAALRELLQNAHDAIIRRRRVDLSYHGRIDLLPDPSRRTLVIRDDGIGLSPDEAETYLGTLGAGITGLIRGTRLETAPGAGVSGDAELIGLFGIGLFSAFMLADRVVVESRRIDAPEGVVWSAGDGPEIVLSSSDREEPGTTVTLFLKPEHARLAEDEKLIEAAVKEFADFLPVPVYLAGGKARMNLIEAAWFAATPDPEAIEQEILTYFDESPLDVIAIHTERPASIAGTLYVTPRRTPGFAGEAVLTTTIRRMVISRKTQGLLPSWASFLRGVLELADCSPTASREDLARDGRFEQVRTTLDELLFSHFEKMIRDDLPRMQALVAWHRYLWAGAALSHPRVRLLLRQSYQFPTSQGLLCFDEIQQRSRQIAALEEEFESVIWFNPDRRQERWADALFAGCESPCVHAFRGFEQSLLAMMAADAAASGTATDLRLASPSSPGFAAQILGLKDMEDAPRPWQEFLGACEASVMLATFPGDQPALAFLNERHELARTFEDLEKQGTVPSSFKRIIDAQFRGDESCRNEVVLNRTHELVAQALEGKTSMPLASVLRLLVHNALSTAGATLPRDALRLQAEDLDWIAQCLRGRKT